MPHWIAAIFTTWLHIVLLMAVIAVAFGLFFSVSEWLEELLQNIEESKRGSARRKANK